MAQMYPGLGGFGMVPGGNAGYGSPAGLHFAQGGVMGGNVRPIMAPQAQSPGVRPHMGPGAHQAQYGYWHDHNAVQLRAPVQAGNVFAPPPAPDQMRLSPNVMAKMQEYTIDHHWRDLAEQCKPCFEEAGKGAAGLNYAQAKQFYRLVGTRFFGDSLEELLNRDVFERFDFNGDEMLEFMQAFKSLKKILYEIFHHSGGITSTKLEFNTPEKMGYTIIKELARGGQGAAILATSAKRGKVVLKTYEKSNPNAGTIDEHITEMEILKMVGDSDYVMHAWEIFQDTQCVYCVNELMAGGDLQELRDKARTEGIALTEDYFRNVFRQCLLGLDHIHEHGLMHCDIKEPNIMIKNADLRRPQIAIIDFGLAHVCVGSGEAGGTPGYVPPETNARHIWFPKGDIFSMGVAFFGLLANKTPNENTGKFGVFQEGFKTMEDVVRFTATRALPIHLVQAQYPGAVTWLPSMCSKEKRPRPRALQLLALPWFKGANQEQREELCDGDEASNAGTERYDNGNPQSGIFAAYKKATILNGNANVPMPQVAAPMQPLPQVAAPQIQSQSARVRMPLSPWAANGLANADGIANGVASPSVRRATSCDRQMPYVQPLLQTPLSPTLGARTAMNSFRVNCQPGRVTPLIGAPSPGAFRFAPSQSAEVPVRGVARGPSPFAGGFSAPSQSAEVPVRGVARGPSASPLGGGFSAPSQSAEVPVRGCARGPRASNLGGGYVMPGSPLLSHVRAAPLSPRVAMLSPNNYSVAS